MLPKFGHEQKGIFSKMFFFCFFILPFLSLSLSFVFHFLALHFHFIGFILVRKDFGRAFRIVGLDGGRLVQVVVEQHFHLVFSGQLYFAALSSPACLTKCGCSFGRSLNCLKDLFPAQSCLLSSCLNKNVTNGTGGVCPIRSYRRFKDKNTREISRHTYDN